ncbi:hypothetical protein R69919_03324 [Paraburkholderia gardini]|nr:hypothetical protein R69919_03324 [Paraburkholderia gardini]
MVGLLQGTVDRHPHMVGLLQGTVVHRPNMVDRPQGMVDHLRGMVVVDIPPDHRPHMAVAAVVVIPDSRLPIKYAR